MKNLASPIPAIATNGRSSEPESMFRSFAVVASRHREDRLLFDELDGRYVAAKG